MSGEHADNTPQQYSISIDLSKEMNNSKHP